ncbi:crystallin J1A [Lingula anatina]|uniref:Crystallin J1A n=1 Tax=Lingula anatina TaxID=7574 RepID=A0A1S3JSM8_LINAN|nr:crystallin J1A [Lingula anatina]|eukprot:XP_013413375.1 crystallin J1A [Lingula anatina]
MLSVGQRKLGAIVGAAVADAASQPLHWNYDPVKLAGIIGDREEVEFWEPSANPYYCIETGRQSCYGDLAYVLLESFSHCKGFNLEDQKERTYKFFGPGSEYDDELNKDYKWKSGVGKNFPIKGPWKQFSMKHFLKRVEEGQAKTGSPTDEQMDSVAKIAPVVAMFAGEPDMLEKVEDAIRLTQESDTTVVLGMAAARIIEYFILNGPAPGEEAVRAAMGQLEDTHRNNPQDLDRAVVTFLREVLEKKNTPHQEVARNIFRFD